MEFNGRRNMSCNGVSRAAITFYTTIMKKEGLYGPLIFLR